MARKTALLARMRGNPQADWKIEDIEKVCSNVGMSIKPPTSGSHYKVSSGYLHGHLTVPAKRPIKAIYIKKLVSMIDAHIASKERDQ